MTIIGGWGVRLTGIRYRSPTTEKTFSQQSVVGKSVRRDPLNVATNREHG